MWTQTCIGYANIRPFYLFCVYMTIGLLIFWYFTIRAGIYIHYSEIALFDLMEPGVFMLWAITATSALFVGLMIVILIISQTCLILTNFTTLDGIKEKRSCPTAFCQI